MVLGNLITILPIVSAEHGRYVGDSKFGASLSRFREGNIRCDIMMSDCLLLTTFQRDSRS